MNNEDRIRIAKQHCNKLIAEFMGLEVLYRPNSNGFIEISDTELCDVDDLIYHTSWDWLMPVVSKCFKTGDDTHQWDNIMDAMFTCDINIVYAHVVEFIKQHNDE